MSVPANRAAAAGEASTELESGAIGLRQVLFQSITQMAPGARVVFGMGIDILYSGQASGFSLPTAFVRAIFIAISIDHIPARTSSAGVFYSYASLTFGRNVAFLQDWLYNPM